MEANMIAYSAALTAKANARDTKDKWSYTIILNIERDEKVSYGNPC